ncbi:MAG: metalloregulator ArsR/SmtB family transcription factor [Candidatus Micrarchaeaceae archaeon]
MTNTGHNIINDRIIKLFFDAFGNIKRFKIMLFLMNKPMSVFELQNAMNCEQSNISHNLQCLLNCGFVSKKINGKMRIYSINKEMKPIINAIYNYIIGYKKHILACNIISDSGIVIKRQRLDKNGKI